MASELKEVSFIDDKLKLLVPKAVS